jgi:hypothetical protein
MTHRCVPYFDATMICIGGSVAVEPFGCIKEQGYFTVQLFLVALEGQKIISTFGKNGFSNVVLATHSIDCDQSTGQF